MFPIHDITGKVIAFGGRIIDGEGAKYINSPEGPVYSKRRNLYLLDRARNVIREKGRSILVEGYMDALRLHKCGFTEAVASLGTSLTAEQAGMLSRYAAKCCICYDSDTAGQNAAIKGMYILAEHGLNVYVAEIPDGKDPDEFLCNNPPEMFEAVLTSAKPLIVKHAEYLKPALQNSTARRSALEELFGNLRRLNPDDVLACMGSICSATMLPQEIVERYIFSEDTPRIQPQARTPKQTPKPAKPGNDDPEAIFCALLWKDQDCRISVSIPEAMSLLNSELARDTASAILSENIEDLLALWLELEETDKLGFISRGEALCGQMDGMDNAEKFAKVYSFLKRGSIERRIAEIHSMPPEKRDKHELQALLVQRGKFLL